MGCPPQGTGLGEEHQGGPKEGVQYQDPLQGKGLGYRSDTEVSPRPRGTGPRITRRRGRWACPGGVGWGVSPGRKGAGERPRASVPGITPGEDSPGRKENSAPGPGSPAADGPRASPGAAGPARSGAAGPAGHRYSPGPGLPRAGAPPPPGRPVARPRAAAPLPPPPGRPAAPAPVGGSLTRTQVGDGGLIALTQDGGGGGFGARHVAVGAVKRAAPCRGRAAAGPVPRGPWAPTPRSEARREVSALSPFSQPGTGRCRQDSGRRFPGRRRAR